MSRNYKEDQQNEIEALESIYCGELEILESVNSNKFRIPISTEEYNDTQDGLCCHLVFSLPFKYPDEAPIVEIEDENFDSDISKKLLEHISEIIKENIGMEMVFSLVSLAQERLNELFDNQKKEREEKVELEKRLKEELERKRFEGTRVTVETFLKWRQAFEIEFGIAEKKEKELQANRKLTGRELFTKDQSLLDSDIRFLMENGDPIESVKIDESLFQNLDLGEEDDDDSSDEDYNPNKDS